MLQMQAEETKRKIASSRLDLQLLRCQNTQNMTEVLPRTCKNTEELSKVLAMKNNQQFFRELRQANSRQKLVQSQSFMENMVRVNVRVRQEKQKIINELKIRDKGKQKSRQLSILNLSKSLEQPKQGSQSKVSVFGYLSVFGGQQQIQACLKFGISDQFNKQDIEDLRQCFKHVVNVNQPIQLSKKCTRPPQSQKNIGQYKYFFQQINEFRNKSQERSINFLEFLDKIKGDKLFEKLFQKSQYFQNALSLFKDHLKPFSFNSQRLILNENEGIFKNIAVFLKNDKQQKKWMVQALNSEQFWEKICYLFSKGPEFEYYLLHHLKYMQEHQLVKHFSRILQGLQSKFEPNHILFQSNSYYREFLMLLQCKYLKYCLQTQKGRQNELIYFALRQLQLLFRQNKPYSYQIAYLKQVSSKMLNQLRNALQLQRQKQFHQLMRELFALGQYGDCLSLLHKHRKITTIQFAILLTILNEIDIKHSILLVYNHKQTIKSFRRMVQTILQQHDSNVIYVQQYIWMMFSLFPSISEQEDKDIFMKAITHSINTFEYLSEHIGFQYLISNFQFQIKEIPRILQLSIQRHNNYAYCLQLALTSCIKLSQIPQLQHGDSYGKRKASQRSQRSSILLYNTGNRFNQFQNNRLNIFQGTSSPVMGKIHDRIEILFWGFRTLAQINVRLMQNSLLRSQKYEQIAFINQVYQQLATSDAKMRMFSYLQLKNVSIIAELNESITKYTNMLIVSFNMLKMNMSIKNRQFEYIVDVLNSIMEEMSEPFKKTLANLQELFGNSQKIRDIMLHFISDIIQAILFLKQGKRKVVERNRVVLHLVCKQVHGFLTEIKSKDPQAKVHFQELQKIMRELNYF